MVGKEGRHITEASAVTGIYNEQKNQYQDHEKGICSHVGDTLGQDYQPGCHDRENENNFINRISVLESICPCRESKTASCIEDGGDRGEHSYRAYQSDTLDDHFFLRDQGKAAGDI